MDCPSAEQDKKHLQELWTLVKGCNALIPSFSEVIDDTFLLHFLRGKKFDVPKAFTTVKNYIGVRKKYAKTFRTLDPEKLRMLESGTVRVLKERDSEGRFNIVLDPAFWDPGEFSLEDMVIGYILIAEELWHDKSFEINGYSLILDARNLSLSHVSLFTPSHLKESVGLVWNSFPVRFKGVYMINSNWIMSLILKLTMPFLPQKLKERMNIWKPHESHKLHEIIDPSKLPRSLRVFQDEVDEGDNEEESSENNEDDIYWDHEVINRVRSNGDFYRRMGQLL